MHVIPYCMYLDKEMEGIAMKKRTEIAIDWRTESKLLNWSI